jgi:hypothetical protein
MYIFILFLLVITHAPGRSLTHDLILHLALARGAIFLRAHFYALRLST